MKTMLRNFLKSCILLVLINPIENQTGTSLAATKYGPGNYQFTVTHQGVVRKYDVHVPASYRTFRLTPVVLNFHGGSGGAPQHRIMTQMDKTSDKGGFISVYPWGTGDDPNISNLRFWNPGFDYFTGTSRPHLNAVDDIGFVNLLLNDLISKFSVDQSRIYAAGLSNGGVFSQRLACDLGDRIAAVASVAGPFWPNDGTCSTSRSIPVLYFHGTLDEFAPYEGGFAICPFARTRFFLAAKETVLKWRLKDSCPSLPEIVYHKGNVTCESYSPCRKSAAVTFCTIDGGGHTWPGGGTYMFPGCDPGLVTQDISASDAIWDFFKNHRKR
jgi:polyhydroxybutyrate depolymerase